MKVLDEDDVDLIEVDKNRLDEELVVQVKLYRKYALMLADAKNDYLVSKGQLELHQAELSKQIRMAPEKFGFEKLTEDTVKRIIVADATYQKLNDKLMRAEHREGVLSAIVRTLDTRKSTLESLVKLRLADYYAEPSFDKSVRPQVEEMQKQNVRKRGQITNHK